MDPIGIQLAIAEMSDRIRLLTEEVAALRADPEQELTEKAAAELCGVVPSTLRKLRTNGGGPQFRRTGKRITYRRGDLIDWKRDRRRNNQGGVK